MDALLKKEYYRVMFCTVLVTVLSHLFVLVIFMKAMQVQKVVTLQFPGSSLLHHVSLKPLFMLLLLLLVAPCMLLHASATHSQTTNQRPSLPPRLNILPQQQGRGPLQPTGPP